MNSTLSSLKPNQMQKQFRIIVIIALLYNQALFAQSSMGFLAYRIPPFQKVKTPVGLTTTWQSLPIIGVDVLYKTTFNRRFFRKNRLDIYFRIGGYGANENYKHYNSTGPLAVEIGTFINTHIGLSQKKTLFESQNFGLELNYNLGLQRVIQGNYGSGASFIDLTLNKTIRIADFTYQYVFYPVPIVGSQMTFYNKLAGKKRFFVSVFSDYSLLSPMKLQYYLGDVNGNSTSGVTKRRWLVLGVEIGYTLKR